MITNIPIKYNYLQIDLFDGVLTDTTTQDYNRPGNDIYIFVSADSDNYHLLLKSGSDRGYHLSLKINPK